MVKTFVLSLVYLLCSAAILLLFMGSPDLEMPKSNHVLALIVFVAVTFWLRVAVGLVSRVWTWRLPRAVLSVDDLEISIRYTRSNRGEQHVWTGHTSGSTKMKVTRAPIAEPIGSAPHERPVSGQGDLPATLQIEGGVFEFSMTKSVQRWTYAGGSYGIFTLYSGYFHIERHPSHFAGQITHSTFYELDTSEIITMNQQR